VSFQVAGYGTIGKSVSDNFLRRLTVNAPVLLCFVVICVVIHVSTGWIANMGRILGVHDTWDTLRFPCQYTSLVTHIFAHSDYGHLRGNMTHLLLVGPSVEHVFGSKNLLLIMLVVAVVSAFAHILLGNAHTHQLGASGVVFACILLNSLVSATNGTIPLSFLLTVILYMGDELFQFFWNSDATSHHAHLTGGLVGAAAGFYIHRERSKSKTKTFLNKWMSGTIKKKAK
jgi:membrane associated rhomboid family serine protease